MAPFEQTDFHGMLRDNWRREINILYVFITGGDYTLSSRDDGIHADDGAAISGGSIKISESCEGIEGLTIDITGG